VLPASVMLDRHGQPVLGVDGRPLVRDANVSLAGMLPPGVLLGADGRPILGADGRPLIRGIDGQTIGELPADVLLGADGNPVFGADGTLQLRGSAGDSSPNGGARQGRTRRSRSPEGELGPGREEGRELTTSHGTKKSHSSQIVPAGRLLTITQLKVKDVPDVDLKGGDKNLSDPYLVLTAISNGGEPVDETRTSHVENVYRAAWTETFRLFFPDDDVVQRSETKLQITLMDKNKKKADILIGDVTVLLKNGSGRMRVEIPSRCVSAARPFVSFHYDAPPEMYFEVVDWINETDLVGGDAAVSEDDSDDGGN